MTILNRQQCNRLKWPEQTKAEFTKHFNESCKMN
jgi:hypothetical protein